MNYQDMRPDWDAYNNGANYGYPQAPRNWQGGKPPKRSGCKIIPRAEEKGGDMVTGWKVGKHGFITFIASQVRKGETVCTNKSGREWVKFCAKITNKSQGTQSTVTAFWDPARKRMHFPDFDLIGNPHAPDGGYFGTCRRIQKGRRR